MDVIIDKIRLKPGVSPERFERWVKERDYATCPELGGLVRFFVSRVSTDPAAPFHYFEVIVVDSKEGFGATMQTEAFQGLVADFSQMADVVETFDGAHLDPGFVRG